MQDFKNVSLSPVDVGGRVLAVGEIASLNGHAHTVHEAVSTGCLLAVTSEPAAEPVNASGEAGEVAGDDETADEAPDQSDEALEKPARKSAARGSDKTKES